MEIYPTCSILGTRSWYRWLCIVNQEIQYSLDICPIRTPLGLCFLPMVQITYLRNWECLQVHLGQESSYLRIWEKQEEVYWDWLGLKEVIPWLRSRIEKQRHHIVLAWKWTNRENKLKPVQMKEFLSFHPKWEDCSFISLFKTNNSINSWIDY